MYNRAGEMNNIHEGAGHCRSWSCEKIGIFFELCSAGSMIANEPGGVPQTVMPEVFAAVARTTASDVRFSGIMQP